MRSGSERPLIFASPAHTACGAIVYNLLGDALIMP